MTEQRDVVGPIETESKIELFRPTDRSSPRFPTIVHELIGCFLDGGLTAEVGLAFTSGTDVTTAFDGSLDNFGLQGPGLP